jgi:hypothetical protein
VNIFSHVDQQIKQFNEEKVKVVDGYDFSQVDTLKRIFLYQNAKFIEPSNTEVDDRVFFDISTPADRDWETSYPSTTFTFSSLNCLIC